MLAEVRRMVHGVRLAWNGLYVSYHNPVVSRAQSRGTWQLLLVLAGVYGCLLLWFLPVYVLLWGIGLVGLMDAATLDGIRHSISATQLLRALLWFLPLAVLYILRTFLGFESLFFAVLRDTNPKLHDKVVHRPVRAWTTALWQFLKRTVTVCGLWALLQIARRLPFIGPWVPALWILKYAHDLLSTPVLGIRVAVLLLVGISGWVPAIEWTCLQLLHVQLASMALARELLEPYFARTVVKGDSRAFMVRHGWTLLGFGIPLVLVFAIPIVGLLVVGYANGAAAVALSELWYEDRRNGIALDTDRRPSLDRLDSQNSSGGGMPSMNPALAKTPTGAGGGAPGGPGVGTDGMAPAAPHLMRQPSAQSPVATTVSPSAATAGRGRLSGAASSLLRGFGFGGGAAQHGPSVAGGGGGNGTGGGGSGGDMDSLPPPSDELSLDRLDSHDDHSLIRTVSYGVPGRSRARKAAAASGTALRHAEGPPHPLSEPVQMPARAQGSERTAFIVESIVLGTISLIQIACYCRSLWLERTYRLARRHTNAAALGGGGGKDKEPERDFPWYCRRLGLAASAIQALWSVDVHGSLDLLDAQLNDLFPTTELGFYLCVMSVWVVTHAKVQYRQAKSEVPHSLIRVMTVLPACYVLPGWTLAVLAHQLDSNLYQTIYSFVFALTLIGYMFIILYYYFNLRAALKRFVEQAAPAQPAAGATTNGTAVVSIAIKPAGSSGTPVLAASKPLKPASGPTAPGATPQGAFTMDTSHLTNALRQLRVFICVLWPMCIVMSGILLAMGVIGFATGAAFSDGELPPPDTFFSAIPFLILDLVAWVCAATICWYSWPKPPNTKSHGGSGTKAGPESVTTRDTVNKNHANANGQPQTTNGHATRGTSIRAAVSPGGGAAASRKYAVTTGSPKVAAAVPLTASPAPPSGVAVSVAADVPVPGPAVGNGWVQPPQSSP